MSKHREILKKIQSLVELPDSELEHYSQLLGERQFAPGEIFIRQDEGPSVCAFVVRGIFSSGYLTSSGKSYIKRFYTPNSFMTSYRTLIAGLPSLTTIECIERAEVLILKFSDLNNLYSRHPSWERLGRKFAESEFIARENREHQLLTLSAQERLNLFFATHQEVAGRIPKKLIAQYLGIDPASLSRLLTPHPGRRDQPKSHETL